MAEMIAASHRRTAELSKLIDDLGGAPVSRGSRSEELYEAYLSLKYLLPRMIKEKALAIARYETSQRLLGDRSADASAMVERHLAELRAELATLQL
jgi:hypothetical protein